MDARIFFMIPLGLFVVAWFCVSVFFAVKLVILIFRALRKYLDSSPQRQEETVLRRSLGEVLRDYRTKRGLTQEYVAEALNVSRQAVSKWENGTADPSTSNLLKLAKLYGVSAEELIRAIEPDEN